MRRMWWLVAVAGLVTGCTGYVWGDNGFGQLGDGTATGTGLLPTVEASAGDWVVMKAGEFHTCGVKTDLSLWCWGRNNRGQVGNGVSGSGAVEASPVQIGAGNTWLSAAPGWDHTCAIDTSRRLWCWGRNSSGQLGDGTTTARTTPTQVESATDWMQVTVTAFSTCGLRATGKVYCWGDNGFGQLGLGTTTDVASPTLVSGTWKAVDGGGSHVCAITTEDELRCWGSNSEGQLGDATTTDRAVPTAVAPRLYQGAPADAADFRWSQVSAGSGHTCGLFEYTGLVETSNDLACWGTGAAGQLGTGYAVAGYRISVPVIYQDGSAAGWGAGWTHVSAGGSHSCGLQAGALLCWGANGYGQLGDGSTSDDPSPNPVAIGTGWVDVSAGIRHTVGTRNEN